MSLSDWKEFVSLIPGEEIILVDTEARFYHKADYYAEFSGCLVFTNKRLVILSKKFKGFFSKKFVGYKNVEYEIILDDIDLCTLSESVDTALKIRKKTRLDPDTEFDLAIELSDRDKIENLYKNISTAVPTSRKPKTVKQEIVHRSMALTIETGEEMILKEGDSGWSPPLTLTNKRLLFLKDDTIEKEIRLEEIAEVYLHTEYFGSPKMIIKLRSGVEESIRFQIGGFDTLVGGLFGDVNFLDRQSITIVNRYIAAINKSITLSTTSLVNNKKFCRYCAAQNENDAVFCEKCAKRIG